ncbi:uncharacterized protein LOC114406784 [Glycine soja]|uniref:Zinc finger PHD-type domain-containing protein n=1 Tax=Glycine soja TaxID=3848 RepID=A0A445LC80_GLYSO|nr:uncharacterized protein LOC114406784 [Glycine soja]KHN07435.1 hypothetical protein glysoja_012733 [Glycine soja]RZC20688.1 hypothetical protein D0Y65_007169 [Glycine soja]
MEKMEHFSHIHPLLLKQEHSNNYNNQVLCSGCEELISSGPVFCCVQCNYVLHKKCAQIARHVKHPFHPQHPLVLLSTTPYEGPYVCDSCRGLFSNFVYHCYQCNYDLDVSCASQFNPDDGHKHEFLSLTNPQSFVCYACGMYANEGLACLCTVCQIWVHSGCAELPLAIRIKGHDHPLKLTYTLHHFYGFWGKLTCGFCNEAMNPAFAGYFCSTCKFAVHCPQQHLGEYEDKESFSGYETEEESQDIDFTFNFFGHEHLLKFTEELENDDDDVQCFDKLCDACVQPIMPPFFSCEEENCGFFLHQSCAELPRTKQHPFHKHPLTLQSKAPYDGIYKCDGCRRLSNGFVYRCDVCQFDLDVCCASLEERIEHESHKHPLFLKKTSVARQCKGCHLWSKLVFVCDVCEDFAIDCGCATLLSKAWHVYDKHPLSLNYWIEGDLREHECGICNEKMSKKQWFYCCDDCDSGAHPYCVVGKFRRMKFGGSFQYDVHSHPLALVEETEQKNECGACGEHCNGWTLECGQCKRYFHREGQCFWKEFKKSAKYLELSGMMRHRYAANVLASTPNATTK